MSVHFVPYNINKATFAGFRVSVRDPDSGEKIQKYLSIRKPGGLIMTPKEIKILEQRANDLEKALGFDRNEWLTHEKRKPSASHRSPIYTQVRGLHVIIRTQASNKNKPHTGCSQRVLLAIHAETEEGPYASRDYCKDYKGFVSLWETKTKELAKVRGLKRRPSSWMKPPASEVEFLAALAQKEKEYFDKFI